MLVLLRHGQSTANAAGLLTGRGDVPLTEAGRRQAAALGSLLGPVTRLISSPLARARDTATLLGLGLEPEIDPRWIEIDYGRLEGRPLAELGETEWRRWRSDPTFRAAGGESLVEVGARVRGALDELFAHEGTGARDPSGDVVVVSHVSPIKAAVAWALGAGDGLAWRLQLSTGSLTRIGWGSAGPLLHTYNALPLVAG